MTQISHTPPCVLRPKPPQCHHLPTQKAQCNNLRSQAKVGQRSTTLIRNTTTQPPRSRLALVVLRQFRRLYYSLRIFNKIMPSPISGIDLRGYTRLLACLVIWDHAGLIWIIPADSFNSVPLTAVLPQVGRNLVKIHLMTAECVFWL